jgi:hypothetical protein
VTWGLWPSLRFPSPLIEPDVRISRIRLSDWLRYKALGCASFSPADVLPLTRRAKMLMMLESVISFLTIIVVAARAVGVLQ